MIKKYFNGLSTLITANSSLSGTLRHRGDIGANREEHFLEILNNHLPQRMQAMRGGSIIGFSGEMSKQLDVIVRADNTPRFEQNKNTFTIAESVVSVISLKSFLNKKELLDSLSNLASIPQLSKDAISFRILLSVATADFTSKHPSLFIYAFDGIKMDTCLKHIENFYNINPEVPKNRYPLEVVVHGKYSIKYMPKGGITIDGTQIPAGIFYGAELPPNFSGYPIASIISYIYSYVDWMPYINIEFQKYINAAYAK
jgi:hypothetical protein